MRNAQKQDRTRLWTAFVHAAGRIIAAIIIKWPF
jgi:hypothetical protein